MSGSFQYFFCKLWHLKYFRLFFNDVRNSVPKNGPVDVAWKIDFAHFQCVARHAYTKTSIRLIQSIKLFLFYGIFVSLERRPVTAIVNTWTQLWKLIKQERKNLCTKQTPLLLIMYISSLWTKPVFCKHWLWMKLSARLQQHLSCRAQWGMEDAEMDQIQAAIYEKVGILFTCLPHNLIKQKFNKWRCIYVLN